MTNNFISFANRANTPPVGFKHASRILTIVLVLLTLGVGQMWGISVSDISTTAATSLSDGGTYVVADSYNGTYLTASGSSWGGYTTDASSAAIFTVHGSASAFYLTCSGGTLNALESKSFSYGDGTTNNLSLSSGEIQNSTNTSWKLRFVSGSGYRWYSSGNGVAVYLFAVSSCSGTQLGSPEDIDAVPSSGQVILSWSAVSNASSYSVTCKNTSSGASAGTVGSVSGSSTKTCTITGLSNGTSYTFGITAEGDGTTYCDGDAAEVVVIAGSSYKVTWKVNGETYKTTYVYSSGTKNITLPSAPSSCISGKEFAGWSASTISGTTNTKPTFVSSQTTITGNTTYHAVFATKTSNSYSEGNVNDLYPGQKVLIVNKNNYALSNSNNSGKLTAKSVSPSNSKITTTDASIIWTVENDGTKYKFKNTYYLYAYQTNTNTSLYCNNNDSKYPDSWTVTTASSSYYYLYSDRSTSSKKLEYYTANSAPKNFFTTYTSNTTDYFKHSFYVPTYSGYFTSCCTPLGQINGSFFWTTHFYPVWPEKHRLKGYYTNLGITSVLYRIPHHLIYTTYISRDFEILYFPA